MPRATTIFDADDSRLSQVWKKIDRQIADAKKKFAFLGGAAKAGFAAGAAGSALLGAGIKSAMDEGGRLLDLSNQTGLAVDELVILGQEAKNAGQDLGGVAGAVNKMQKAIASGSEDKLLGQLVGDVTAFKQLNPVAQFQTVGKAIAGLKSPTDRTAAAMALFGKSGATLLSMFASQGFGDAAAQVGGQAKLLAQDAALFDDVSDKLHTAGIKLQGFFVGVADKVAPVLKPIVDDLAGLDGASIGQEIGDGLASGLQMLTDGTLGDALGLTISIAVGKGINYLTGGLTGAVAAFGSGLVEAMKFQNFDAISAKMEKTFKGSFSMGEMIDVPAMEAMLQDTIGTSLDRARLAQEKALAEVPTVKPKGGPAALPLAASNKALEVSDLTRVGGWAVGNSSAADPLLEANRLAAEGNVILQNIHAALTADTSKTLPGPSYYR